MLEMVLAHLHNWFVREKHAGTFVILDGVPDVTLADGQYYRIVGSLFNDGLHKRGEELMRDEVFCGEVWALAVPCAVIEIAEEIEQWLIKNPETDKLSESFGGYQYQREARDGGAVGGWVAAFGNRLNQWRKPYD